MNIDWAIACRYVEVHDNLGTIIGAGIDTFTVPELPTPIQVVLAVRLLAMTEEFGRDQEHTATNRVRSPSGEAITELTGEITLGGEPPDSEWLQGMIVPVVVAFEATEEGT